ncbi:hypothetical protein Dalk_1470 [Desulfatibacillum aliphaticivorans]|uniref:Uncharacterized protein n=1 Tax=Desulfatibacillum aliphaticivorans TaxID=218208 RepID=B8FA74_DESAL|nr:hypothetical protein Dalk_1470 [Desulfatibacillum aliphaticivorans]
MGSAAGGELPNCASGGDLLKGGKTCLRRVAYFFYPQQAAKKAPQKTLNGAWREGKFILILYLFKIITLSTEDTERKNSVSSVLSVV